MRPVKDKIFRMADISEGPRNKAVCFKINSAEFEYIKRAAEESGTTESELMRSASLKRARWIVNNG